MLATAERRLCRVLEEDPDLAEAIPIGRRQAAIDACVAPLINAPAGPWTPPQHQGGDVLGVLLLSGILIRKLSVGSRYSVVLMGAGDLLQPWLTISPMDDAEDAEWIASVRTRMVLLDGNFTRQLGAFPELATVLVHRVIQRNRELAVSMAIASHTRVDSRLHMLMWQMAGRWGRIRTDGVLLPVKLTHQLLGDLVAARRPTVTTALSDLAARGVIEPVTDGWLLKGGPPEDMHSLT